MIYVYALTGAALQPPPGLRGFGDEPLERLVVGDAAAVYSQVAGAAPAVTAEHLWRHEQVVEALDRDAGVLPVRFGTVLDGPQRLAALLERNRDVVRSALERVRGLVEVGVRVTRITGHAGPADEAPSDEPEDTSSGRAYLLGRVAEERRRRAAEEALAQAAAAVLDPLAERARAQAATTADGTTLSTAYLLAPDEVDDFVAEARALDAAAPDVALRCTGPWPAHSFSPQLELAP